MRNLIFITGSFPWGKEEAFIENEFPFLANTFEKIWIISNAPPSNEKRPTCKQANTLYFSYELTKIEKFFSFKYLFSITVLKELFTIEYSWHFPLYKKRILTLLFSYAKGISLKNFIIKKIIISNQIPVNKLWVYSYWLNDMSTGVALLKKQINSIKAIARAHRWDVYPEQSEINYLPLRRFITHNLDAVYSISINGAKTLSGMIDKLDQKKIRTYPLGTINQSPLMLSSQLDELTILSCSSLIKRKRVDRIILALSFLSNIKINWIHIGGGPEEPNIYKMANHVLSALPNISYTFKGALKNQEIINFYKTTPISLFINTSDDEGVPVSIMEAMSFGVPAIATNVGGVSEIIDDKVNGFLIRNDSDPKIIAEVIYAFSKLSNDAKQNLMTNARIKWEENYNAEKNYTKFINEILSL